MSRRFILLFCFCLFACRSAPQRPAHARPTLADTEIRPKVSASLMASLENLLFIGFLFSGFHIHYHGHHGNVGVTTQNP